MIRLIRASGDYISQYHEETRDAYAACRRVDFEYRQDEYHRHWATSIGETFDFHGGRSRTRHWTPLPRDGPTRAHQQRFDVRGFHVELGSHSRHSCHSSMCARADCASARAGGLRTGRPPSARPFASLPLRNTGPAVARLLDYDTAAKRKRDSEVKADPEGRISFAVDCAPHEVSFEGQGTSGRPPILLPVNSEGVIRVRPGMVRRPFRIYNPRLARRRTCEWKSPRITRRWKCCRGRRSGRGSPPVPCSRPTLPSRCGLRRAREEWSHARLNAKITYDDWVERSEPLDVLVAPDPLPAAREVAILDGRTQVFPVFRQKGNQGGGAAVLRTVKEGDGNGNGVLEPGERATIWVRVPQGLDAFDKNNWCRAKVYSESPWLTEIEDIQEEKQREWTGAQNRSSLVTLSPNVPSGVEIPVILDCESWSFHFTPDVRYGRERLYQAFQLHKHHLYAWTWKAGQTSASK